jgi:acyl-CoA thioesterase-1
MRIPALRLLTAALLLSVAVALVGCGADETVRSGAATGPVYVAIGASESVGTGARNPGNEGWVPVLAGKMPSGTRLANLGIGGLRTSQALDQVLPVAVDLQPSVVTVWLAVNDLADGVPLETYRADLDTLLSTLARQTHARVYVANIPDLTVLPAFRDSPSEELRAEIQRWNAEIADSVKANGGTLVDLFNGWSELRDRPDYVSRDGLHPSSRGHTRVAEIFWQTMQGA